MPRLIWVFAWHTVILLVLSWGGSLNKNTNQQTPWISKPHEAIIILVSAICFRTFFLTSLIIKLNRTWWTVTRLLAHLSRRLTRWAYSIPMVCRSQHFQTWVSLKPVGQSWSNFMRSITGVGERLHKVLGQIGSKLWFPWQQKAPIDLQWGKQCLHLFSVVFDPILFILADNEDMHKILDEFKFRPDRTTDYGVSCPWASKKFPIDL